MSTPKALTRKRVKPLPISVGGVQVDGHALLRRLESLEATIGQQSIWLANAGAELRERNLTLERHLAIQAAETRRLLEEKALLLKQVSRLQADKQLLCTSNRVLGDELEEARTGKVKA